MPKILILKPSSLGDVVQALPVLRLIKRHLPQSRVFWWIEDNLAPLLESDPDLAGVVPFHRQRWAKPGNWLKLWRTVRWMREEGFDWVIDLQGLARSSAFGWLANARGFIGLDSPREGARGFYDIAVRRASFHTHAVDWYLGVLPRLGVPAGADFQWLPPRPEVAEGLRQKWPVGKDRWISFQPGARWLNKRWPAENYSELARQTALAFPELRFAILGGPEDRALGQAIARVDEQRCLDLTGRLSLPEMVEWIRLSEAMVTNDTGPMHVAAALGRPLVALLGPTEPCRTGPYGQINQVLQLDLPCVPCMGPRCRYVKPMECLRALPPSAAFDALAQRLRLLRLASADGASRVVS